MAHWDLEAILKKAKEQEEKYGWLYAAWSYEHALRYTSEIPFLAETWQRIGFCYQWAARQAEDREEFERLQTLAGDAYEEAASLFGKEDNKINQGKRALCNSIAEYLRSWVASTSAEKKKRLEECRLLGTKALNMFQNGGNVLDAGKAFNTLLICVWEQIRAASTEEDKQALAQEGLHLSDEAISVLSKIKDEQGLLQAYSLASLHNWYAANISDQEETRKALAQKSLECAERTLALSKEVNDPYSKAQSLWAITLSTLFFTDKTKSGVDYAQEMLQQGSRVSDNYLKGVAFYLLSLGTDDLVSIEDNPDLKKRRCEEIIEYAENAIRHLQVVAQDDFIADTYMLYTQSYSTIALDFAANPMEKLALSKKAVEIGRKGLEYAVNSESPESMGESFHALSKALHFYSTLVTMRAEKTKILQEALEYRNKSIQTFETAFPSNHWVMGVAKIYAAQIKTELAGLRKDGDEKTALLKEAVSDSENGLAYCEKWIAHRPETTLIGITAGFEDSFGKLLEELQRLTEDKAILSRADMVYDDAAKKFEKVDLPSRVAESHWRIARNQDQLGEHQEAAKSFHRASKWYEATVQKMPPFSDFFFDYASYMKAWSEIEKARVAHDKKKNAIAMRYYRKAAKLLKQTKEWSFLSSNFRAWALLERAESLSRRETSEEAIENFKKANELFREAKNSLQVVIGQMENPEEKPVVMALVKVCDMRGEYCLGRIGIEEARIFEKQGYHVASSEKYAQAADTFQKIVERGSERIQRELRPIVYLCRAWQKMRMAEAKTSSNMYNEAARLFEKACEHAIDQSMSLLALAHSSFCKALAAGTEFEITRDLKKYTEAKKYLEIAASNYLKTGLRTAAEYASGTQRLFDAYVYIETAKIEMDPEKKAKYYSIAEKLVLYSAESYTKAQYQEKTKQVQQLLGKIREEKEIAVMLNEILQAPTIISSTESFVTPTSHEERAVGLENFEGARIQASISEFQPGIAGENFNLDLHIVNVGKKAVLLSQIDEILPKGFELVAKPDYCQFEDSYINLKNKRLDPLMTEEIKIVLRSYNKGSFEIHPKITYVNETGHQLLCMLEPITIEISESLLNRIATGYEELDKLLIGGIPETYPVILTSPFCDERDLLIKRFLKAGVENGEIVFYLTVKQDEFVRLAQEHKSNLYLFMFNSYADKTIRDSPNIFKLQGVEKLTDISISLTKALRELREPENIGKRVCIEIVSDVLLQHQAVQTRRWLTELITELRARGFTTLAVINPLMHPPQDVHAILGLFEGEIALEERKTTKGLRKVLKIKRMYNQRYLDNELPIRKEKLAE